MAVAQGSRIRPADLGHALPTLLVLALLAVSALLALMAPSRVTTGVQQVVLGEGADQQTILTANALDCAWENNIARCTATVAGRPLVVRTGYGDDSRLPRTVTDCTAEYAGERVDCRAGIGEYRHAAATVWLRSGLGLTDAEVAELRDALPWWHNQTRLANALLVLCVALAAAAGVAAYLLDGRTHPLPARRGLAAVGAGALALGLFAVTGLLADPHQGPPPWFYLLAPHTILLAALPAMWQFRLATGGWRGLGRWGRWSRWGHVFTAVTTTAVYSMGVFFIVLMQTGFID